MERRGVRIFEAREVRAGLALAQHHHPEVIVLDLDTETANEDGVQSARAGEIVGVLAAAGGEAVILAPCGGRIVWGVVHCQELLDCDAILCGKGRGRERGLRPTSAPGRKRT